MKAGVALGMAMPAIAAVPPGVARPRWSVMIPTFNCAHLVGATIESVVSQAPGADEMEIVVVDDASSDDIGGVVAPYADRVRFHRQDRNLGVPRNLTECIRLSRGEFVHILHGDDQVRPGFYRAMERALADLDVGAAYCRQIFMNERGDWLAISPLEREADGPIADAAAFLAAEQRIMTPSICVRRRAYERLGGFHPALKCAEDWEMWVRIAAHYPIAYVREPLALYRMQDVSNTGRNMRTGTDTDLNGLAIEIIRSHLPEAQGRSTAHDARAVYARSALMAAQRFAAKGDLSPAIAQFRAALRLSCAPSVILPGLRTLMGIMRGLVAGSTRG